MSSPPSASDQLSRTIAERTCRVGVIGLGYAGLPLAEVFVHAGFPVVGLDVDTERIARLERGESYLGHIVPERIRALLDSSRFTPTHEMGRLGDTDAVLICVPTPLTEARDPDLSCVIGAAESIARCRRQPQLVVLESTTYPGTTRDVVRPILEAGGLRSGQDFFLAYSPEREDPGNTAFHSVDIPRVVGGLDPVSGRLAQELYGAAFRRVVPVSSAAVAEACKILENSYRAVNIALVNELKMLYDRMSIDIWEVIEAARTKPFGFQAFFPGPGWGGHCIPIDPFYLAWLARKYDCPARFIELAGEVNRAMPAFVVDKIADALNDRGKPLKGSRVVLLGMAYKKDVDDVRESPGLELLELLHHKGARVGYNDPHVPRLTPTRRHSFDLASEPVTAEFLEQQDCAVIVTDHSAYDWEQIVEHAVLIVDTRNATRHVRRGREKIVLA